jgi:hypothetical protein
VIDEIPYSISIVLQRGRPSDAVAGPSAAIAIRPPSEESPGWFIAMDANRDGEISRREFLGGRAKFESLDIDSNGFLELPEAVKTVSGASR